MKRVIVIGGGAAGILAAVKARENGAQVTLLEKNQVLGKKIMITGKGRCNLTNNCSLDEMIQNIPGNGPFLYGALSRFSNQDVRDFFEHLGLSTKVERGGRVFPESDRAEDVVDVLEKYLKRLRVKIIYHTKAEHLGIKDGQVTGVYTSNGFYPADAVIIATGGASYPGTGSTGDGYRFAQEAGHTIIPLKPSLVPLETREAWVKELQGLTLKNVQVTAWGNQTKLATEFGEMLFTHFGVSGPIILSLSKQVTDFFNSHPGDPVTISIDLKPALSWEQLDARLQRDFEKFSRKQFSNSLNELLPKSLIPVFIKRLPIPESKPVNQITREERGAIIDLLKDFTLQLTKARSLSEAIVTAGGVHVKEVKPKTMESKLINNLYFAGEVLDVDGYTGGFNLQAAFSTGCLAGIASSE